MVPGSIAWLAFGALVAPVPRVIGSPPEGLPIEPVSFASESGSTIAGWLIDAPDARATVVLLHPLRADRRAMLARGRVMQAAGYRALLIDFQGHGESSGEAITMGWRERHDATAAVAFVRDRWPEERIGVVGWSLGGAAALLGSPLGIDAIVLESVYPTLEEAVQNRLAVRLVPALTRAVAPWLLWQVPWRLGVGVDEIRPIDSIFLVGCPVLVLAGGRDRRTPLTESRRLVVAGGETARMVAFPAAGHVDLFVWDEAGWTKPSCRSSERSLRGHSDAPSGVVRQGVLAILGPFLVGSLRSWPIPSRGVDTWAVRP